MTAGTHQFTRNRAFGLNEKVFTATGTLRTGRSDDTFIFDNPVKVTDPAADTTLTVPDGVEIGQQLFIVFTSDASSKTVTITTTTGDDGSLTAAGDYAAFHWCGATSGWQKFDSQET